MSRLRVRTEVVTPAKAKQWLKTNRHNRPLSRGYLRSLVNAIRAGEWEDNGETIKFNGAGRLVDGQHRLTAVVQTNRPLPMTVVEGLNETAFDTIDQGKRRQVADALARDGVPYYITVAGAQVLRFSFNGRRNYFESFASLSASRLPSREPGDDDRTPRHFSTNN